MSEDTDAVREGYDAFARRDLDTLREQLAPDVVWHVGGRSVLARAYRGVDDVLAYFGRLHEMSDGTFRAEPLGCGELAPGLVGCLVRLTGDMPLGRIDDRVVHTFQRVEGRTTEVRTYAEQPYELDEALGLAVRLPGARTPRRAAPIRA